MSDLITRARKFAYRKHAGQTRKYTGDIYYTHCHAVAMRVMRQTTDAEVIAAAYLHDTIEDTDTARIELELAFGSRVAHLVHELTDQYTSEKYPTLNREERKRRECVRLGFVSDDAKLIKLADISDNTSSIVEHDPKFAVVYLREKAALLEVLI